MKKLVCMILAVCLLCSSALAAVETTGNVNLRKGPGKDYDVVASVPKGTILSDLDSVVADDRGVDWFWVEYNGIECWISSKYAEFTADTFESQPLTYELSYYYGTDLIEAAEMIGLSQYSELDGELANGYFKDGILLMGNYTLEGFVIESDIYSLYGATVGMDMFEATNACIDNGLRVSWIDEDCVVLEYYPDEFGPATACVNLFVSAENGMVYEISMSTYTSVE